MSQLRTGNYAGLENFQPSIGKAHDEDQVLHCSFDPHNIQHLFDTQD